MTIKEILEITWKYEINFFFITALSVEVIIMPQQIAKPSKDG